MAEKQISVRALAFRLDTDAAVVSRWRNGLTPNAENKRRIASALRVPQKELWP